jgi:paraquat-inducible protein B
MTEPTGQGPQDPPREPGDGPADEPPSELPQALVVKPRRNRISVVWIIPVLAALVALGIVWQRHRSEGPTITIVFAAAEGIEPGKTFIKYKDVNIGQVRTVQLTEDFNKVEVTAKMSKRAAGLMVEDAKFWIVRPTVSLSGISGLNTLLSGNYIGFEAGSSDNEVSEFEGLDQAPFVKSHPGTEYVLKADDLGSLSVGSPVYYRKLPVGQIIAYKLAEDGKSVEVRIFVDGPYDSYVRGGTRFWNVSGIDVSMDANGFDVRTESLVSLLIGGLAFDDPPFSADKIPAPMDTKFTLYTDRAMAMKAPDESAMQYVLRFNESLRGLAVGAPVTFLGLTAGEVTAIDLAPDKVKGQVRPRVKVTFSPERLVAYTDGSVTPADMKDETRRRAFLRTLIEERGLRAQLRTGSLVTGQLYVAFEYFPNAKKTKVAFNGDATELPVVDSTLTELEAKLTAVLDRIDKLPIEDIAAGVKKDLASLDATLNEASKTLGETSKTMSDAGKLVRTVDSEVMPQVRTEIETLHRVLASLERTIDNVDATLLGPNAPAQQELRDALNEFTRAARSMRLLIEYLERHPESPIRGKSMPTMGEGR